MSDTAKKAIKPNWEPFAKRPTWSCVSSRELSVALGVCLQTISNWKLRGILPEPEPRSRHLPGGNRNWYRISKIRSWAEDRPESDIHWEWAHKYVEPHTGPIQRLTQVETAVWACYKLFDVEKPPMRVDFSDKPWNTAPVPAPVAHQAAASP